MSLISIAVGVLITVALFFIGYSSKMDRTEITTGRSTNPVKAEDRPANVITDTPNASGGDND